MNLDFKTKLIGVIAVLALILSGLSLVGGNAHPSTLGGETNYDLISSTKFRVGVACDNSYGNCLGTKLGSIITGTSTCNIGSATLAASASSTYQCTAANVGTGDFVFASLPATAPALIGLIGAHASTTGSGFFEMVLFNYGTTTNSVVGATSSVQYWAVRPTT